MIDAGIALAELLVELFNSVPEDTISGEFYHELANLNDIVAEVGVIDFILTSLLIPVM